LTSKSQITFYGGVHEIGGNKFLVEDKETKIFLDFGMQMGKVNQYFAEFLNPRICNGMGDLRAVRSKNYVKDLQTTDPTDGITHPLLSKTLAL
jgi:ribonuclease J